MICCKKICFQKWPTSDSLLFYFSFDLFSPKSVTFNQFLRQWPEISGYFGAGRDTQQECLFIATWANKLYLIVSKFKAAIKCLINYITFGTTVAGHTGHMVRVLLWQPSQSLNRRVEGSYYHTSTVKSYGIDWCVCVKKCTPFHLSGFLCIGYWHVLHICVPLILRP